MTLSRIDLNERINHGCRKKCNKQERSETTENDLCMETDSILDDLPIRCVGQWAVQKIYLLNQYFGIFTKGMKNLWEINYIEICSGPGRCISRESGTEFNGTSLNVLNHEAFEHVNKALFFDLNPQIIDTLKLRIGKFNTNKAIALIGDYNKPEEICAKIKKEINSRSLNIVFIDPTDCSVPFSLLRHLKSAIPNIDFIINIAIGTDYNRNIKEVLLNQDKYKVTVAKYSRFLDSTAFFRDQKNINFAIQSNHLELRNAFRESYMTSLRKIGYEHFRTVRVEHFYDVLFASTNNKGVEFWDKANKYKFDGEKSLF